jgi:hypothetical protein
MPVIKRAVELEPSSPWHRLTAARVLWRYNDLANARKAAEAALTLADTEQERAEAQRFLSTMPADTPARPAAAPATSAGTGTANTPASSARDVNALVAACQKNDAAACAELAPIAEKRCTKSVPLTAMLQFRERSSKDEARARRR